LDRHLGDLTGVDAVDGDRISDQSADALRVLDPDLKGRALPECLVEPTPQRAALAVRARCVLGDAAGGLFATRLLHLAPGRSAQDLDELDGVPGQLDRRRMLECPPELAMALGEGPVQVADENPLEAIEPGQRP